MKIDACVENGEFFLPDKTDEHFKSSRSVTKMTFHPYHWKPTMSVSPVAFKANKGNICGPKETLSESRGFVSLALNFFAPTKSLIDDSFGRESHGCSFISS